MSKRYLALQHIVAIWEPKILGYIKVANYPFYYDILRCCQYSIDESKCSSFQIRAYQYPWQGECDIHAIFYGLHLGLVNVVKHPALITYLTLLVRHGITTFCL